MGLRAALEKISRQRVTLAAAALVAYVTDKPLRRQLRWAIVLYVASVALFAAVCGVLHLTIMLFSTL
ncbi:hypothetical protein [Paraburkholderia domus]|uniref:hypothetical protein n=1 Tax=Paraburkholderia domus TaxID=2793075 RepID=UPI001B04789D|nr:hypothetical protein [Paraburkholderia domus]CAE6841066.1 hypothetical protein R75483_07152 [Paraburkholderia domus]